MTWMKATLIAGGLGIAAASVALGSGGFGMPHEHFDGVNRYGYATWWASVGTLDLGDGVQLPLVAGFQSDREWSSPVLGKGWILALTDSSLVALDEQTFRWIMPDGQLGHFYRDRTTPTLLDGGMGWKGEIQDAKEETVTLSAPRGTRYVYRKGKLASMTTSKNRTLQWLRAEDGALQEIREGGRTHLKVEIAPAKDVDRALFFGGQRLEITWGERPHVGVAGVDRAVTRIALAASSSPSASSSSASLSLLRVTLPLSFAYGFDAKQRPTFTVTCEGEPPRVLAWDPQSRLIATDGEWTYAITPGEDLTSCAAIERTNAQGQTEFWHRDIARGREIVTDTNGVTRTTTWFVYGKLAGKLREITETANQQTQLVLQRTYDEQGQLLRETKQDDGELVTTVVRYDSAGRDVEGRQGEKTVWRKTYDGEGRLLEWQYEPGSIRRYAYPSPGVTDSFDDRANGYWTWTRMQEGRVVMRCLWNGETEVYDARGEMVETWSRDGTVHKYYRKPDGFIERIEKNGKLTQRNVIVPELKGQIMIRYDEQGRVSSMRHAEEQRILTANETARVAELLGLNAAPVITNTEN